MSFVKDAISMNVLHQMMHRQWCHMHKVHHMPMKELSVVNLWFFDLPDLVIENIVAPLILVILKLGLCPEAAGPVSLLALAQLYHARNYRREHPLHQSVQHWLLQPHP